MWAHPLSELSKSAKLPFLIVQRGASLIGFEPYIMFTISSDKYIKSSFPPFLLYLEGFGGM